MQQLDTAAASSVLRHRQRAKRERAALPNAPTGHARWLSRTSHRHTNRLHMASRSDRRIAQRASDYGMSQHLQLSRVRHFVRYENAFVIS
jgi:hypothetical protein